MPGTLQRSVLAGALVALLALLPAGSREACAADSDGPASPSAASPRQPVVTAIGVVKGASGTQVTISGDTDLEYRYFILGGSSLAIDIPGASSTVWPADQQVDDEHVSRIQIAEQTGENPGVRVVLALKRPDGFTVSGADGRIVVAFAAGASVPAAADPVLNRVLDIAASQLPNEFRVAIRTETKPQYQLLGSDEPDRIFLQIDNAFISQDQRKVRDLSTLSSVVEHVASWVDDADPTKVIVSVKLSQPSPFRITESADGISLLFLAPPAAAAKPPAPRQRAAAPLPADADGTGDPEADGVSPTPVFTGRKMSIDFVDADLDDIFRLISEVSKISIIASDDVKGKRTIKILDVPWDQALDLILRSNNPPLVQVRESPVVIRISTVSRQIDEERRTAELAQRRIDNAALQLETAKENLRRVKLKNLADSFRSDRLEKRNRIISQPLVDRTFLVSYAELDIVWRSMLMLIDELARIYEFEESGSAFARAPGQAAPSSSGGAIAPRTALGAMSDRTTSFDFTNEKLPGVYLNDRFCPGCIFQKDDRSNTIFVRTYPGYLESLTTIVDTLDRAISSVVVEARIVEVVSGYSHSLGIQWGATAIADPAHGNSTSFAFPNSIAVDSTAAQPSTGVNPGSYLVNLPANNPVAGIGLSLGHIADTFSLDVKLSAMESLGKTKILSTPKLLATPKQKAKINVGSQLPVPRTDSTGSKSVEWKSVGIILEVTPQVTYDNNVFLDVHIEKSSQGPTVQTTEGQMFSIESRDVTTKVLVGDNETAVIGGIFLQTANDNTLSVPWFSKLPILGALFRTTNNQLDKKELIIFLTPRIVYPTTKPNVGQ